jgi:hypothetical protein
MNNIPDTDPSSVSKAILYLCAGTQSSGSTLISWCFLQRRDMDGILDQRGDVLPRLERQAAHPYAWCKITINGFRLSEVKAYGEDEGWDVRPMLVARDVRSVLNSLLVKSYGQNGTTAEEPPLRLRLRRFKEDWELARRLNWPILQYEQFIHQPEEALKGVCAAMGLPWDEGMLHWPKQNSSILAPTHGNATFRQTCGDNLEETLRPARADLCVDRIPPEDLAWLEEEFAEFNQINGYPAHAERPHPWSGPVRRLEPKWENTRRFRRRRKNPISRIVDVMTPQ